MNPKSPSERLDPVEASAPTLLRETSWDPGTGLGRWLEPPRGDSRREFRLLLEAAASERLGPFRAALKLLSVAERHRARLLIVWTSVLLETSREPDPEADRIERIQRAAFLLAQALAGEPAASPLLAALAAEAGRRTWGRQPLDALLELARDAIRQPRAATVDEDRSRCQTLATAFLRALFGTEPASAACDFAAGLYRLSRLLDLKTELRARRFPLALELLAEPVEFRSDEEILAAVFRELEAIRILLLRGARAVVEVPLTFRRPTHFLISTGLELLGRIEERPRTLLAGQARLPRRSIWLAFWRARRSRID